MEDKKKTKPKFKKRYLIIGIFLLAFCLAVTLPDYKITIEKIENKLLSFVSADTSENNWTIEGDLVYFEDSNAFLSAYPHTVSSSQWVYFNLTSYNQSGNIDAVWGFKGDSVKPTKAEFWLNYSHPNIPIYGNVTEFKDCHGTYGTNYNMIDEFNMWCNDSICLDDPLNENCYWEHYFEDYANNADGARIFWNETGIIGYENKYYYDWKDISHKFTSKDWNYQNMTKWWLLKNVTIQKDINYQVRAWVDVPISFNGVNGKYFWAVKPTNMDLSTAKDKGYFYALDPWFNSSWQYKKNITINHSKVNGSQTNFPVLINLTDTDLRDNAQADGDDIVFTNSTGSQLDHEIEYFNSTDGRLVAWVRIPTLSNTIDTVIQMYYGNAGASNQENVSGVWDSNFVMVQHLQEIPAGTTYDSTQYDNDGTTNNMDSADQVAGQIDGSLDFDGGDDYVLDDDGENYINGLTAFSLSLWIQSDVTGIDRGFIAAKDPDAIDNEFTFRYDASGWEGGGTNVIKGGITVSGNDQHLESSENVQTTDLQLVTFVWSSGTQLKLYLDGALDTPTFNSAAQSGSLTGATKLYIGQGTRTIHANNWDGIIDEVRISNVARTAGWIATEYNNQYSPDSFYSVGGEEEESAEDTTDPTYSNIAHNTTIAGNSINFSIDWNDNSALNPNGQYIFSTNNSGIWVNETTNFTSTPQSVSVVKTLNSTVGLSIGYRWYGTDNASNSADTGIQSLTTTGADTCSYNTGNWNVDCSDNCVITENVDVGGNNISITGTGTFKINGGNVSNYEELYIKGTDESNICEVYCYGGGCFT